jgi:hypothetical protein
LGLDLEQPAEVCVAGLTEMAIFPEDRHPVSEVVEQEFAVVLLLEADADAGGVVATDAALGTDDFRFVDRR